MARGTVNGEAETANRTLFHESEAGQWQEPPGPPLWMCDDCRPGSEEWAEAADTMPEKEGA
jgi:hypothetical protein